MSIFDYVEESKDVPFTKDENGKSFTVHPITLQDLGVLLKEFREDVEKLYEEGKANGKINAYTLIDQYPNLVCSVIARASREEDTEAAIEAIHKFPLGVQVTALLRIWYLMALDMEELGNVLGEFAEVLGKVSDKLEKKAPSKPSVSGNSTSNNKLSA